MKLTATQEEGWPPTNTPRKTSQLYPPWTRAVCTKWNVIASGRNTGDQVTRNFDYTCNRLNSVAGTVDHEKCHVLAPLPLDPNLGDELCNNFAVSC